MNELKTSPSPPPPPPWFFLQHSGTPAAAPLRPCVSSWRWKGRRSCWHSCPPWAEPPRCSATERMATTAQVRTWKRPGPLRPPLPRLLSRGWEVTIVENSRVPLRLSFKSLWWADSAVPCSLINSYHQNSSLEVTLLWSHWRHCWNHCKNSHRIFCTTGTLL